VLALDHLRRRAGLRRQGALPETRLAYLLRSLAAFRRQTAWLDRVGRSRTLQTAAALNPRIYERWQRHYISREFDLATCARLVEAHYRFIARACPERLRERLLRGHDVRLATLPLGDGGLAYLHARAPDDEATGELGLFLLNEGKEVISSCTITFGGDEGLLIGAVCGSWAYMGRSAIARFTRATGGLRPRDLLLALIRALAVHHGVARVRGVSRDAHPLGRRAGVTMAAYDRFWRRHGGAPGPGGFHDIPLGKPGRGDEPDRGDDPREAFIREACAEVLQALGRGGAA
jgi:uncharacterized protein VirK/YbjX